MKNKLFIIFLLLFNLAFTFSLASAESINENVGIILEPSEKLILMEANFPSNLKVIEDEAFEGTALVKVSLSEKVTQIGERAFADIISLCDIRIPISTSYIACTAFEGSNRTTITAPINSYARTFARTQGLPFSPIIMFCASTPSSTTSAIVADKLKEVIESDSSAELIPETQWRRIEEINVTRTEELIANHVQGRSPPMA